MRKNENVIIQKRVCWHFILSKMLCLIILAVATAPLAYAQSQTVKGTVKNTKGEPLPNVTVAVEGTTKGINTDADGHFSINVSPESTLIFSFIGMETQRVAVGSKTTINVILKDSATSMSDVVVVAYGQQKKVSVTGAIATIETKELKKSPAANFSAALAGRLPGLAALQTSGQPGNDAVNLYLRGVGTLNDASPLILIDGVPRSNISTLDPNEVASVTILKDASATAVFGVRGANGVILITTRKGKAGKMEMNLSADYSVQQFINKPDRIHSWEFAELRNQAFLNSNPGADDSQLPYTQYMIDKYKSGEDPVFYPDRDVFHDYFKDWAPQTRLNANFNGGSNDFTYFLNIGYIGQGGNFKTEPESQLGYDPSYKMNRYNFRGNIDYKIAKNLTVSLNIASYLEKMNSPSTGDQYSWNMYTMVADMMLRTWNTIPTDPGPITVGGYGVPAGEVLNQSGGNAYDGINRRGYEINTTTTLNSNLSLNWGLDFITKGLSARGMIAYDAHALTNLNSQKDLDIYAFYVARNDGETSTYSPIRSNIDVSMRLDKVMGTYYYLNYQLALDYTRSFGKHNITGMALFQRDNWDGNNYFGADIPYNILGYVGRATYNYDNRYLAEFNIGYNGSEQFAPKNRFGTFPAVSVGWVATNEKFLKGNRILTNLKLRASYGLTGNDKMGGSRFLYQSVIQMSGGTFPTLGRGLSVYQGLIGNDAIQWEVAKKKNLGIDLEILKTFSLTVDLFNEHRDKILITRSTVPVLQGIPIENIPKVNLGVVDNKGLEAELTYRKQFTKNFSLTLKGNFAYNQNVVKYADEVPLTDDYAYRYRTTGYSIGQNFGYLIDYSNGNGFINTEKELNSLPKYDVGGGTPRLGDYKYIDVTGDGVVNSRDMVPIGYPSIPRVSFGFSGVVNYKAFDLSFLFSGIGKCSYYMSNGNLVTEFGNGYGFYSGWLLHAWTPERYANGEEILYPALGMAPGVSQQPNSVFIMNRAFLRLKNLEIGYTLPNSVAKKAFLTSARIYVNGSNLLTWNKYPINTVDPEQAGNLVYGLTRMFNAGINIVF